MGYKILLADDSVTVQKIITLTFSDEGVDVSTVNNGDEAISRLQYMRPALVMADVSIPGKSGYEICEFVKNHPEMKNTPVVLLVPAFEPFDEERARRVGADQHLTKPFQSIRTLIATVKGLLEPGATKPSGSLATAAPAAPEPPRVPPSMQPTAELAPPVAVDTTEPLPDLAQVLPTAAAEPAPIAVPEPEPIVIAEPEPVVVPEPEPVVVAAPAPEPEPVVVSHAAVAPVVPVVAAVVPQSLAADEWDHVLDLDDVLPAPWTPPAPAPSEPVSVVNESAPVAVETVVVAESLVEEAPAVVASEASAAPQPAAQLTLSPDVIDEIVSRVVAQLSDTLAQKLSAELTRRLAPEVAELVKQQHLAERVPVYTEPDSLLDLDEI